jgi:DNA-binding HxlR family transcriptional regulator
LDRTVYAEVPRRAEYRLTRTGHSLLKPTEEISQWAEKNAPFVQRKRQEFAARNSTDARKRSVQLPG